jgi:4-aminobutyrate aminotransferase-like enzyme
MLSNRKGWVKEKTQSRGAIQAGQPPEIAAAFKPGDHLSTFGGNPISCAAALANINFMEKENLPARATETGNYAMTKLRALQKHHPLIGEVRAASA